MVVSDIATATDLSRWNNLGPSGDVPLLTTRFDPVSACATQWIQNPVNTTNIRSGDYNLIWQSTNGNPGGRTGVANLLSANYYELCRPFTQPIDQSFYTGICTSRQTIAGIQEQQFGSSRRWKGWCCDRGMSMVTFGQDCQGDFSTPRTALAIFTTTIIDPFDNTHTISGIDTTTRFCTRSGGSQTCANPTTLQRPTVLSSGMAFATPFGVYWEESDLSNFPSDYASSLVSLVDTTFGGNNTTKDPSPGSKDNGLSPGAIAGIAVGIGLFVIIGIVILLFFWRRKKQQKKRLQRPNEVEMDGNSQELMHPVDTKWRAEADGSSAPVEAGTGGVAPRSPVELDSTQRERDR